MYQKKIISASIIKRKANSSISKIGISHYGAKVKTEDGSVYLIHSTPEHGTTVGEAKLSKNWSLVEKVNVRDRKTVGEVFKHVSGRTKNKLVNYLTSGGCIATAMNVKSKLMERRNKREVGGICFNSKPIIVESNIENIKIDDFDKDIFDGCLLLTMNGKTNPFSVSLDPHNDSKLKLTLVPQLIIEERKIGDILFKADWTLKQLNAGRIDSNLLEKLRSIGYKSYHKINNSLIKEQLDKEEGERIWMEPSSIEAQTLKIEYKFCHVDGNNKEQESNKQFSDWLTNNFDTLRELFPIFDKLDEIFRCFIVVLILRKRNINLFLYEEQAFITQSMEKYLNHEFEQKLFDPYKDVYNIRKSTHTIERTVRGGIINPFSLIDTSKVINFRIHCKNIKTKSPTGKNEIPSDIPICLKTSTKFRLRYGFEVNVGENETVKSLYKKITFYLPHFDADWLKLRILDIDLNKLEDTTFSSFGLENGNSYDIELIVTLSKNNEVEALSKIIPMIAF